MVDTGLMLGHEIYGGEKKHVYRLEAVFYMRLFSSRNHRAHSCCLV